MASTRIVEHIGRVLGGRYRLLAPIGTGASAHVFLADDTSLGRRVAVKVLHPALASDQPFLRRFRAEARAAAALNHPNVMAVYDWGEDDDTPYLVCEYLGGGSVRTMLDAGHRLTVSQAALVGLQAARGLDYAHRRGLVHRDIKPANLLFDDDGRLRIADFGVARALAEAAWTEPAGAVLGTARYASPEQAQGAVVDGKADVYSLAVVLVEAVTGRVPFATDTTIGTLMARVQRPIEPPPELGPLAPVVEQAGRPDPGERLSAAALVGALERATTSLPPPEPLPLVSPDISDAALTVENDVTELGFTRPEPRPPDGPTEAVVVPASAVGGRRRWARVAAMVLAAAAVVLVAGYLMVRAAVPTHPVPSEVGKNEVEAKAALRRLKFDVRVERRFVDDTDPGDVTAQSPDHGRLREGSAVRLVVSRGPTPVAVPDLTGMSQAQATDALHQAGLAPGKVTPRNDEQAPSGRVLDWAPKEGQLPKGSTVDLTVSAGPAPRTVPDVSGRSYESAAADLTAKGLVPVRGEAFNDTVPKDKVVGTTPKAGASVDRGSKITVIVSKGPDLVQVPGDLIGASVDDATAKLKAAGLQVGSVFGPPKSRRVIFSNPPPSAQAKRGSSVNLYAV